MVMPQPSDADSTRATTAASQMIRTPDQRVRVFVSSTLDELAAERAAARAAITQLRLTPILFESGARPYPPRELYRSYLAQSDIFVGIYWQRYGWIAPSMQLSGLEDEYQLAGDRPKLIYVKTPAPGREPRLQTLLDRIRAEGGVSYQKFASPDELRDHLANDLAQLLTERFASPPQAAAATRERPAPLHSLSPLPVPRSPLVDREHEVALVRDQLQRPDVGLVTLTGPGGVGKTRLAIQVAADLAAQFADGVAFVSLATLKDPDLVEPTVARALGVNEISGVSGTDGGALGERLRAFLRPRQLLLLLDNAERLLSAAPLVTQLLDAAPRLKVLATSREPLRVRDEHVVPLSPLVLPDSEHLPDLETLAQVPAVALFVARAREVQPAFALTAGNAQAIAEICRRLDGLPLAIELAAARSSMLPPQAMLARLAEHRLPLLTQGARDAPQRQQTLRNTIAWSYDLLDERDKALFRRLAVFVGGFTLAAAAAVCVFNAASTAPSSSSEADDGADGADGAALEQLGQLVDKSLVQSQQGGGGDTRFTMLGTIHEYAQEQLVVSGETDAVHKRHADYFLVLAEEANPQMYSPRRDVWMERLDREDANLRSALAWSMADKDDWDAGQTGLRLAGALTFYWWLHGDTREARQWLEGVLERTAGTDRSVARGKALVGAAWLAWAEGDLAAAVPRAEEGLSILREREDKRESGRAAWLLGLIRMGQRDSAAARSLLEESRTLFAELGDVWDEAMSLYHLGMVAYFSGDRATARACYEESLQLFQEQRDVFGVTVLVSALEVVGLPQGGEELARSLYAQTLSLLRAAPDRGQLGMRLITSADSWLHQDGGEKQAKTLYQQGLQLWREMQGVNDGIGIVRGLAGLAEVAAAQGQAERAGRLFGVAARLLPAAGPYRDDLNSRVAAAAAHLDATAYAAGWDAGQALAEEQAITEALQDG